MDAISNKEKLEESYSELKKEIPQLKDMNHEEVKMNLTETQYSIYLAGKLNKWITNGRLNKVCTYWNYTNEFLHSKNMNWDNIPEYCRMMFFGARYYVMALSDVKKVYHL